eukprot:4576292-Prorocentrum_lima.AAC.1
MTSSLVGSEMCIRDRLSREYSGIWYTTSSLLGRCPPGDRLPPAPWRTIAAARHPPACSRPRRGQPDLAPPLGH